MASAVATCSFGSVHFVEVLLGIVVVEVLLGIAAGHVYCGNDLFINDYVIKHLCIVF